MPQFTPDSGAKLCMHILTGAGSPGLPGGGFSAGASECLALALLDSFSPLLLLIVRIVWMQYTGGMERSYPAERFDESEHLRLPVFQYKIVIFQGQFSIISACSMDRNPRWLIGQG